MQIYPLYFRFVQEVGGRGFRSLVTGTGRLLMESQSSDDWWSHGVEAGGVAGRGSDPIAAFHGFRITLGDVMESISEEASSFEEFELLITTFFNGRAIDQELRWEEALSDIRAGRVVPAPPFDDLPRWNPASHPVGVTVTRVHGFAEAEDKLALADHMPMAA